MIKPRDWLLILVGAYAVYQIGWKTGWTPVNIFILVCTIISLCFTVLERKGIIRKLDEKRDEETRKREKLDK
jgi:hypothetical protein